MTGIIGFSNKNIIGNLGRTFGLACIVMVLAFTFLAGSIIVESLRLGETNVEERLGADLMAVPAGSSYAQESILINGTASSFYMPAALESEIGAVMGVKRVSSQIYMTSISDSDCCEFLVQLIAYNPDTDFTIKPWIAESYSSDVGTDQLVVGSNIQVTAGHIRLFDHQFEVVARLAESGTGMDSSVFMVKETMRHMIAYAAALGFRSEFDVDSDISVVLVDTDPDYSVSQMVRRIQSVGSGSDVDVVSSADVVSKMTMQMGSLIEFVEIFKYTVAAASAAVLATLFATAVISRKREFAMLRMIGATRSQVASAAIYESAAISFFGALAGIALSLSVILPFSGIIGSFLGMPYMSPTVSSMIPDSVLAFLLAFVIGPLSSAAAAFKLSRNETYALMKEGERLLIGIQDVTVEYSRGAKSFNALDHVSAGIEPGDFMAVLGKSGSGKTTLLNLIAGIQRPTSGTVTIAGRDLYSMSDRESSRFRNAMIGYVPQRNGLFSHLTVLENVLLPTQLHDIGREPREASEMLDTLGIGDLSGAFPKELSGGEQRRASIARALINRPDVLLADEPTSDLDRENTVAVMELLSRINRSGTTVIVVTHELDAAVYGKRLFHMDSGRMNDATERLDSLRSNAENSIFF